MSILVHGARRLDADGIVDDSWLLTEGDRIAETGTGDGWRAHLPARDISAQRRSSAGPTDARSVVPDIEPHFPSHTPAPGPGPGPGYEVIDAAGAWLTPGFIDLHGHGGGGHSFDGGADAIRAGLAVHRAHGTTRSVISLVSNPPHVLSASLDAIARLAEHDPLILGAHLEGPFLAPAQKGAHNPDFLGVPTRHVLRQLLEAGEGHLVQVTLAPEIPGALEAIDTFVSSGVVVALGHTEAPYELARAAFDRGATLLTHAFNAMPGIRHRAPGPLTAAFDDERVVLELIADGVHVHPAIVELAFRAAPGRITLITDAMAAAGAPDGSYRLGSLEVSVRAGRAVLAGTSTIAGSTLTQDAALRSAIDSGIDPVAAVTALTLTPARVLGRTADLGLLRPGHLADLVLLTPSFHPTTVIAAGAPLP